MFFASIVSSSVRIDPSPFRVPASRDMKFFPSLQQFGFKILKLLEIAKGANF